MATENEERVALIDLDGSMADYPSALALAMNSLKSPHEPPYEDRFSAGGEPPHIEARRIMVQRQPGFWRKLRRIEEGFEVYREVCAVGFLPHVLTKSPRTSPGAWSEKVEWCAEHLPGVSVTITGDKSLVYGRVLMDDYPPYFESWLAVRPRGLVICIAQLWNAGYAPGGPKEHPSVFRYDGDPARLPALRRRLVHAFERPVGPEPV